MARYIGPKSKIARKFGEAIYGEDKVLSKKNYPPGQHGVNRRKKTSEYGMQLREKQKAKYTYGVLERQFRNLFDKAARTKGITGEVLLQLLESRLDNVVYRVGFASSRAEARQLVGHGHYEVNGHRVDIASYLVKAGDVITICEKSRGLDKIKAVVEANSARPVPAWIDVNRDELSVKIINLPNRDQIDAPVEEQLIVEFYSR